MKPIPPNASLTTTASPARPTLAVCSIARNEERDLPGWLATCLRFADELVVVLDESEDRTLDLLREAKEQHGDRVRWIHHAMDPVKGFAGQRNAGIEVVRSDWILHTDIDERPTPELVAEIREAIRDETKNGFRYRRLNHFLHHPVRGGGWAHWNKAWLARRGTHRFVSPLHETTEIEGGEEAIGQLEGEMWHLCDEDYVVRVHKNARYMQGSGQKILARGIRVRWYHMLLHPGWKAVKAYTVQGGWRDGTQGFLHAIYTFTSVFNWWAYAWSVQNHVPREHLEQSLREDWSHAPRFLPHPTNVPSRSETRLSESR